MKTLFIILLTATISFNGTAQNPKLIEFSWYYPDVDQLSKNIANIQNTPFDGICFSLQRAILEAFDTMVHKQNYFEYDKLKSLNWGKYNDNYVILRGYGILGGRWFENDAWKVFTENMKSLSKAMATSSKIKGILFDPEYYYENKFYNPWTYSKTQYPNQTLEEVQVKVKERGIQFISALQQYKTNLTFISIWLTSLIAEERKYTPIQDTRHVLLLSFIEGVLEGKNKNVTIIEGNEYAYWNFKPSQFLEAPEFLKKNTKELVKSNKAKQATGNIPVAQTIFYDGLLAAAPSFEKGFDNATKWKWMEENMKYAMATANSVVWFYSERLNWYSNKVNDTLVQIIENSKMAFISPSLLKNKKANQVKLLLPNSIPVNDEKGYFYYADPKTPMKTGQAAFSFKWNAIDKNLRIDFIDRIPASVTVYANNVPCPANIPKGTTLNIKLDKFTGGKIIVLAKYDDKLEASGIQMY